MALLLGCSSPDLATAPEAARAAARWEQPAAMSPGTLGGLGSYVWEASFDQRGDRSGKFPTREEVARLVWAELDLYEYQSIVDGALNLEERRIDNAIYKRTSPEAPWLQSVGASGDSWITHRTLQLWDKALRPLGDQVAWTREEDSTVEGRPVRVYRLRLAPAMALEGGVSPAEAARRKGLTMVPRSVDGVAYVDEATGNRLLAEVEVRFVPRVSAERNDPLDEVLVTYRESRSITPLPPDIVEPDASEVKALGTVKDRALTPRPNPRLPGQR